MEVITKKFLSVKDWYNYPMIKKAAKHYGMDEYKLVIHCRPLNKEIKTRDCYDIWKIDIIVVNPSKDFDYYYSTIDYTPNRFRDEYQVKLYGDEAKRKDIDYNKKFDINVDSKVRTFKTKDGYLVSYHDYELKQ
jgi:hypothetical protein